MFVRMVKGCLRRIEKINICIKLAKIAFYLLRKIWDSVYKYIEFYFTLDDHITFVMRNKRM